MLSEHELVQSSDNVFLIFRVIVIQVFDQLCFNQALLIESLFVFEDFDGDILFLFVIVSPHDDTETAFSELFVDFVTIPNMLIQAVHVLIV